jgi:Ala-tRNA(Pro) deacylase
MAIAHGVSEFLRQNRIPYELFWHQRAPTGWRAAQETGLPADEVVKAVVLDTAGQLFMVLIPANAMLDMRAVRELVGADVKLADPDKFEPLFADCVPGPVPVTGPAYGFATLLDDRLARAEDVYFDAGDQEEMIHVKGSTFRQALGPVSIGRFTQEHQGEA